MTIDEVIEYWEGLRKTFSSQLEKEENHFGRMHLQTTIDVIDTTLSALRAQQSKGVEIDQVKNAPLTLDELREMDGEPVYIVYPGYEKDCHGHWEILERAGKWGWNGNHGEYFESNYESMWLAYRRKPEEGTE